MQFTRARAHARARTHTHTHTHTQSHSIHLYQITATFPNFTSCSVSTSTVSAFILLTLAPPFLSQPLQSLHNTMSSDLSTALDTQQFLNTFIIISVKMHCHAVTIHWASSFSHQELLTTQCVGGL